MVVPRAAVPARLTVSTPHPCFWNPTDYPHAALPGCAAKVCLYLTAFVVFHVTSMGQVRFWLNSTFLTIFTSTKVLGLLYLPGLSLEGASPPGR